MPRIVPARIVEYIKRAFPRVVKGAGSAQISFNDLAQIRALIKFLDGLDDTLLPSGNKFYKFAIALESIRAHLEVWSQRGGSGGDLPAFTRGVADHQSPVRVIFDILTECPNEVAPTATSALSFISDDEYRERLRADLFSAEFAFENGHFKAATVMAGSVLEALLFVELEKKPKSEILSGATQLKLHDDVRKKGLEYAALGDLIKLAENFGLVAEETVVAANLARDFRNLIHPGKEKRKGAVSNRATARSALAAVDHVIEELSKKCAPSGP
jgi:hypothetical protein